MSYGIFLLLLGSIIFQYQGNFGLAQKVATLSTQKSDLESNSRNMERAATFLLPSTRLQSGNFGTAGAFPSLDYNSLDYPRPLDQTSVISPLGLHYNSLIASNGLNSACSTCSSADYSYAQKCCSFGHRFCCNVNSRPTFFTNTGNNGYSYPSSWRPSSSPYDYQYSQGRNDWQLNRGDKPGHCYNYNTAYQSPGGYMK